MFDYKIIIQVIQDVVNIWKIIENKVQNAKVIWNFQQGIQWPQFEKYWFKPMVPKVLPGHRVPRSAD